MTTHDQYCRRIEKLLRDAGRPFVAVDDAKKAVFAGAKIAGFDFLIYASQGDHLLACVVSPKGYVPPAKRAEMHEWARVFGVGFVPAFIVCTERPELRIGHAVQDGFTYQPLADWLAQEPPATAASSEPAAGARPATRRQRTGAVERPAAPAASVPEGMLFA